MKKKILSAAMFLSVIFLFSCEKEISSTTQEKESHSLIASRNNPGMGHLNQTKTFTSEVAIKWMDMQVKQMRAYPAGLIGNVAF